MSRNRANSCYIACVGLEMKCPLCGTTVPSGHEHRCSQDGGGNISTTRRLTTLPRRRDRKATKEVTRG